LSREFRGRFPKHWQKGDRKVTFLKSWLFTKVLEQLLKRYLFTSDENICSLPEESEAD
jgi:hypothetical protein